MQELLGDKLYVSAFSIQGELSEESAQDLIDAVIAAINMTKVHYPARWVYPANGLGGVGFTICSPITESFLVMDAWPKADQPHAYLLIGSCKSYDSAVVVKTIRARGFGVHESFSQSIVGAP